MKMKRLTIVGAAILAATTLQAQTYNDTVRTHTWSVYGQGGVSIYHDMRGGFFANSRKPVSPDVAIGVKYNIRPWVRVGLNLGYTMAKSNTKDAMSHTLVNPNFTVTDPTSGKVYSAPLTTKVDRFQNRNAMHMAMGDLNVDFNIMELWHNRQAQQFNLWVGVGAGYLHAWNRHSMSASYSQHAEAKGAGYDVYYDHNYLTSDAEKGQVNALYIPASLSAEYDITPRWTVGLIAQYKYLPINHELTPKGIISGGLVLRYNFVGSKMPSNKKRYEQALADQAQMKALYEKRLAEQEQLANGLRSDLRNNQQENDKLRKALQDCENSKWRNHTTYFSLGKYELSQQEQFRLDEYVALLKEKGEYQLEVIGEASADGSSAKNKKLSEQRAKTVVDYLKAQGIKAHAIRKEQAIGDINQCHDPMCRRVMILVE